MSATSTGDATHSRPPLSRLEQAALVHAGGLLVFATWAFDGNIDWAKTVPLVKSLAAKPACVLEIHYTLNETPAIVTEKAKAAFARFA